MASRRWLFARASLAIALVAGSASADPAPQQKELARDLMQKGRDARTAHDNKVALESFKAADDIMHVPTTGFEVARSQVDLGLLVEAHETLLRVMHIAERPDDSQAFRDARGYAKVLDDEIVPRIPQIKIRIEGPPADRVTSVAVDGVGLPLGAMLVPYKINAGHHVVVAKTSAAEGRAEIDVQERETKDVVVRIVDTATPTPVPTGVTSAPPPVPEEPPTTRTGPGTIGWIGFGVAGAGVLVGAVTGVISLSDKGSLDSQCNGTRCPPSAYDTLHGANTLATVSTISFIVAGIGAGVGVTSWLLRRGGSQPATTGVRVSPWIGAGSAGAYGTF
jgi:hypothetical protein